MTTLMRYRLPDKLRSAPYAIRTGARLKEVLDRAGVKPGAIQVRFGGLDESVMADAPRFLKSLTSDHARDGEVAVADVADERPRSIMVRPDVTREIASAFPQWGVPSFMPILPRTGPMLGAHGG